MTYSNDESTNLDEILSRLETIYSPLMNAEEYTNASMGEVVESIFTYMNSMEDPDEGCDIINENSAEVISRLAYLYNKAYFFSLQVIVFDNFPNTIQISQFVFKLTRDKFKDNMDLAEYKAFLAILSYIDEERIEHKYGFPYRVLKLLFIMSLYKAFVNTAILAKFILHQVALSAHIDV